MIINICNVETRQTNKTCFYFKIPRLDLHNTYSTYLYIINFYPGLPSDPEGFFRQKVTCVSPAITYKSKYTYKLYPNRIIVMLN